MSQSCILCGRPATEKHHIIPRGQTPGSEREDWDLNLAPLCTHCHVAHHGEQPVPFQRFWAAKRYTLTDLALLALLPHLKQPKAGHNHLVVMRAEWAAAELDRRGTTQAQAHAAALLYYIDHKPIPDWIVDAL